MIKTKLINIKSIWGIKNTNENWAIKRYLWGIKCVDIVIDLIVHVVFSLFKCHDYFAVLYSITEYYFCS